MALTNTGLVDDDFKVVKVITGKKNEDSLILEIEKLKGSTNESKISVANLYYELVNEKENNVEKTGNVTLQFAGDDPFITLQGRDNYGLKPSETKFNSEVGKGNITIKTDTNVKNFSLIMECHKESGFSA
tara:strand:- start:28 stop:417 length:390 start_codon:yes stop_codon:yes gene_type:complete